MAAYRKKFISLDLETTHLDPKMGRIMEIGAVAAELFFDMGKQRVEVKFGKNFTTLVNPETKVSDEALALTGINQAELASAPVWQTVREDLRDFLGKEMLLGHNLAFDLGFLENQGLTLTNPIWDSLELSQTLLPLSLGHSLEYLADHFAVGQGASHRALPDSQSAARVLAEVLNEFLTLPKKLQTEIKKLLADSEVVFRDLLLDLPLPSSSLAGTPSQPLSAEPGVFKARGFDFPPNTIITAPISMNFQGEWLAGLALRKQPGMIAASHPIFLDNLPRKQVLASPEWALCEVRFQTWLKRGASNAGVAKVLIKILIFRHFIEGFDLSAIKWNQPERDILGLFLCEVGLCQKHDCGFAKSLAEGVKGVRFCDLATVFALVAEWPVDFRTLPVLLFDLSAIEEKLTENYSQVWNLRKIRQRLEQTQPLMKAKDMEVVLNELDLFFGILHLVYLKEEGGFAENVIINLLEREEWPFAKLYHPAEKLLTKLEAFSKLLAQRARGAEEFEASELEALQNHLAAFAKFVKEFFLAPDPAKVYWLKFNAEWVDLNFAPREVAALFREFTKRFQGVSILETELPPLALSYFEKRLGLEHYAMSSLPLAKARAEFAVEILEPMPPAVLRERLWNFPGSTIAVLPNERELENFFESSKGSGAAKEIIAYKFSGSLASVRARLIVASGAARDFVLLLTTRAYQRYFVLPPRAQNLFLLRLPFEAPGARPELGGTVDFQETVLPRTVQLLHQMICRFTAPAGEGAKIFIADRRILTDFNQTFLRYFQEFPDFKISTS